MTEREWLSAPDPQGLLEYAGENLSARKVRLFAVACCRTLAPFLDSSHQQALHVAEQYADRFVSDKQLRHSLEYLFSIDRVGGPRNLETAWGYVFPSLHAALYADAFKELYVDPDAMRGASSLIPYAPEAFQPSYNYAITTSIHVAQAFGALAGVGRSTRDQEVYLSRVFGMHAHLFRDIAGNPFQQGNERISDFARLNPHVKLLAARIYSTQAFYDVPLLARVLLDNGLNLPSILEHVTPESIHVKGCWLVDCVLGFD